MKTAVLVDGGFFIKRYRLLYPSWASKSACDIVRDLRAGILKNLRKINNKDNKREIYRIFFYDCPPLTKRIQNPISKRGITLAETPEAKFRIELHEELKRSRKVALRLGRISEHGQWVLKSNQLKALLNNKIQLSDLSPGDVIYDARQKGVDMKIGLDISSLSYQKSVDQIILIAGDSDFVPAAKLARREGIDFILDPMWNNINPDLHEHIDGLVSCWSKPTKR